MQTAAIDVMGTLFSLERPERALLELGLPMAAFEEWFARARHATASASLTGVYRPFRQALESELPGVLERHGVDPNEARAVVRELDELEPVEGAADVCARFVRAGWRLMAVTDLSRAHAQTLLTRYGLAQAFGGVLSTDEVARARPHPDVYARIAARCRGQVWLMSQHHWDLAGAAREGLCTVWISDGFSVYPDDVPRPSLIARDVAEAAEQLCEQRVVPLTARLRAAPVAVPSA